MPEPLTTYITQLYNKFGTLWSDIYYLGQQFPSLGTYIAYQEWGNAYDQCVAMGTTCYNIASEMATDSDSIRNSLNLALTWIDDNWVEVTWESIIEAWMKDDFVGREWTIACIDRMRQILWDEPFNIIFAARPEDRKGELV